jgi:hypothetical protein
MIKVYTAPFHQPSSSMLLIVLDENKLSVRKYKPFTALMEGQMFDMKDMAGFSHVSEKVFWELVADRISESEITKARDALFSAHLRDV